MSTEFVLTHERVNICYIYSQDNEDTSIQHKQ